MFGQYPLQVNGFKDLHECLEAAMVEGEIESLHSENSGKSGQEVSGRLHCPPRVSGQGHVLIHRAGSECASAARAAVSARLGTCTGPVARCLG